MPTIAAERRLPQQERRRAAAWLGSDRARFTALALFLASVFLMGGGSRADILSLPILRPLCLMFIAYALTVADKDQLRALGVPFYLLGALAAIMLAQLIPLPPELWASLPGRELYAEAVAAAGVGQAWRPLSLAPSATLNSLFSLSAPFAALLLFAVQGPGYRRRALLVIAGFGVFSAFWGLFQLSGSPQGPLYLYRVTNDGLPVGLFANRNHQAVFLAGLIPLVTHLGLTAGPDRSRTTGAAATALAAVLLLVVTILMTGSRAGVIATAVALAAAALILHVHNVGRSTGAKVKATFPTWLVIGGVIAALGIVAAVVVWFGQALAFERLLANTRVEEMRGEVLPILFDMTRAFFPVGAGFGAFDAVYDQFETVELLNDQYLNQAHADWLQLLIEGGVAAGLVLLGFLAWLGRHALRLVRAIRRRDGSESRKIAALAFIVALGIASLFDYPLRIPSLMAVFAILCAVLAETQSGGGARAAEAAQGAPREL